MAQVHSDGPALGRDECELMSSPVTTIDVDFDIDDCLAMMTNRQFRHLPVMADGRLIGIVSIGDIGKWIMTQQSSEIRDLQGYIMGQRAPH
jgi:CBS domain-containing protein